MTTVTDVRLGQRVYGVTKSGEIVVTLVKQIELNLASAKEPTNEDRVFDAMLKGTKQHTDIGISFRTLTDRFGIAYLSFDEALKEAIEKLPTIIADNSRSIAEHHTAKGRLGYYQNDPDHAKRMLDDITTFTRDNEWGPITIAIPKVKEIYRESDFRARYIPIGTLVWVVDTQKWRLIHTMVTEVHFAPNWDGRILYHCGAYPNISAKDIFCTKRAAMKRLATEFWQKLPGTIDPKRVPIDHHLSHARQRADLLKKFEKIPLPKPDEN